ncbi:hypothetical protein JHK85_027802 [Glycine max]|nr:hypothetical protein JHK85_027802 [Glycine max]
MTSSVKSSEEYKEVSHDFELEEEEELFEIDLEAVNCIPPPHFLESCYYTSTGNIALLANLSFEERTNVVLITEPTSLGEYLRLPFLGTLGVIHEKMEAQFHFQFQR